VLGHNPPAPDGNQFALADGFSGKHTASALFIKLSRLALRVYVGVVLTGHFYPFFLWWLRGRIAQVILGIRIDAQEVNARHFAWQDCTGGKAGQAAIGEGGASVIFFGKHRTSVWNFQ
jgi:hypothetical protein